MKAIVIKLNDKVVFCESLKDLTLSQFNDLRKEAIRTIEEKEIEKSKLVNRIHNLEDTCNKLNAKINYLGKQIAIDRGEIDADSEEDYVITIEKIHHEQPQAEETSEEELFGLEDSGEEDIGSEEPQEEVVNESVE